MNECEIRAGEFVVTGGDTAEVEEFSEVIFDLVPEFVEFSRVARGVLAVFRRRDDHFDTGVDQGLASGVAVVGAVGGYAHDFSGR